MATLNNSIVSLKAILAVIKEPIVSLKLVEVLTTRSDSFYYLPFSNFQISYIYQSFFMSDKKISIVYPKYNAKMMMTVSGVFAFPEEWKITD